MKLIMLKQRQRLLKILRKKVVVFLQVACNLCEAKVACHQDSDSQTLVVHVPLAFSVPSHSIDHVLREGGLVDMVLEVQLCKEVHLCNVHVVQCH
jgi:hypothetical protein